MTGSVRTLTRQSSRDRVRAVGGKRLGSLMFAALPIICLGGLGLGGCFHGGQSERDVAKSATRLDLAKDFLRKHQLEAAHTESNRSLALNPTNDEAFVIRGLVAIVRAIDTQRTLEIESCLTGVDAEATQKDLDGFLKKAEEDFATATKLSPTYGEAWSNRGVVATLLEDYPAAAQYLTKALENPMRLESPGLTRAHLGWALFHEKKYVEAAKELRQAVQFQPNMCVATYRLARVYFAREEWEKAAELFQTASDDPSCGSQEASLFLMKTRMQQGLVEDARRARDACLKISRRSCVANQCRADGGGLGPTAMRP
ncbi:MAG: tetratricopeptide repeat protein [Deltaproteobacteria bacterium]|nr:tetratricopeptide repeat protein [Deltaproteobacteria bacterium]MDQ3295901.1 tetratricopeptide repeat protein [Myxococcota bacterium]